MRKQILSTAFAVLFLAALLLALSRSARCDDPLGCISISPSAPLEIGLLYAPPGSACPPAAPAIEALEQRVAAAGRAEKIPLALAREESGFSLPGARQALARLLARPNLALVLVLDCRYGADPSLSKLISDAGLSVRQVDAPRAGADLDRAIAHLLERVKACGRKSPGRYLIGRSVLNN